MTARPLWKHALACAAVAATLACQGGGAWGQSKSSDPARVQERIEQDRGRAEQPAAPAAISGDRAAPSGAAEGVERFTLAAVSFSGMTAFDAADMTAYYERYLATEIDTETLREIVNAVTGHYRERGYFLSRAVVEPQGLAFGILQIRIIEGRIAEVRFPDAEPAVRDLLAPFGERIAGGDGPANVNAIERYLLLMNDLPGIEAKSAVEAVDRENGLYALNIDASRKAVQGNYGVDNRGTRAIGRDEAYASVTANGWLDGRESTRLGIFTIPSSPNELRYVELNQTWALGTEGTTVSLTGSYSTIDAGADEEDNDLHSWSARTVLQLRHPLVRSRKENLTLYANAGYTRQRQHDFGALDYDDRLQVVRGGTEYYLEDDLRGFNYGTVWLSQGLGLDDAGAPRSRAGGRPIFTKLYARAERRQMITDRWAVKVSVAGQVANNRLLSNEEFSLGGWLYGRGYDGGEIAGTQGLGGLAELQYGDSVELGPLTSYQFYGFYDGGTVWETSENSYNGGRESLTSAGGGVRVGLWDTMNGGLEVAKPLTRPAEENGGDGLGPRVFIYLNGTF